MISCREQMRSECAWSKNGSGYQNTATRTMEYSRVPILVIIGYSLLLVADSRCGTELLVFWKGVLDVIVCIVYHNATPHSISIHNQTISHADSKPISISADTTENLRLHHSESLIHTASSQAEHSPLPIRPNHTHTTSTNEERSTKNNT